MNEADLLDDFNGRVAKLSKLINSWDLVQTTTKNEFDILAKKILKKLYDGQSEIVIKRLLESELCLTYGLYKTEFDADRLTNEVMTFWNE
jgi:hypothetical protein